MFDVIFLLTKNTEKRLIGIEGAAGPKMRTLRYKGKTAIRHNAGLLNFCAPKLCIMASTHGNISECTCVLISLIDYHMQSTHCKQLTPICKIVTNMLCNK